MAEEAPGRAQWWNPRPCERLPFAAAAASARKRASYGNALPTDLFRALLETDDTVIEAAEEVRNALDWYELGAEFADALHLAACGTAVMHTFDRNFCKAARVAGIAPEVRIWEV
ncbi:MAG: hypothetical protein Q8Q28_10330 [Pseudomonadota bacterium]|nr:hypothetical protein [Pseudomonadota bacterium]